MKDKWFKKAKKVVNFYVRLRDAKIRNGKLYASCFTCGREWELITTTDKKMYHAGHLYKEHQYSSVRFHHDNLRGQCSVCNKEQHGQMGIFKRNLIVQIGQDRFDALTFWKNKIKVWDVLELERIIREHEELLQQPGFKEKLKLYDRFKK